MSEDFHSAPIPIRLSCRYSNGTVVSYMARAVAYSNSSLRVLSAENFEKGVQLSVLAPFLQGIVPCRVAATSRSREQPAYFELDLNFAKKPPDRAIQTPKGSPVAAEQALIPEEVAKTAREFASQLEQRGDWRISKILEPVLPHQRALLLAVVAAATALLLQDKNLLDLHHLAEDLN